MPIAKPATHAGRPGETDETVAEPKRKRKAGPFDDEDGTPIPHARDIPSTYTDHRSRLMHSQFEAPLYSIDRLFTEKELGMNLSRAHFNTRQHFESLKAQGKGANLVHQDHEATAALAALEAGDMDSDAPAGTASPHVLTAGTYHATRSTQRANPLADLANAATSMAPFQVSLNATASKTNPAAPLLTGTSELERENDMYLMARPIGDPSLEIIVERSIEKSGPVEASGAGSDGPASAVAGGSVMVDVNETNDEPAEVVPTQQSSTGVASETPAVETEA